MCLYPQLIKNPKYKHNNKNGGIIPPVNDPRILYVPIGCGNCIECTRKKAREWQIRLSQEIKDTPNGNFITLTFSNESIAHLTAETTTTGYHLDNQTATIAVRRFLERWRKTHKISIKHWLITELGHEGTENVHLHGIIWFQNKTDILQLDKHWQYGHTWKGYPEETRGIITGYRNYVSDTTAAYMMKYITKRDDKHNYYKPIILTSPGIGRQYTNTPNAKRNAYKDENTTDTYKTNTGHEIALPIYYRNKLYSETQREELWLQKLDKQERWIMGHKIDISKGYKSYINQLKQARVKNKKLGYKDNRIDYNQKEYENKMRTINQDIRIAKAKNKEIEKQIQITEQLQKSKDEWIKRLNDTPF